MEFRHPNYYKKLKASQEKKVISPDPATAESGRAPGPKLQAASDKPQASSAKQQATSHKPQASSSKRQASSPKRQASSLKPQATSSMIREPRKSFTVPEPRCSMQINVLCGCFT